MKRGDMVTDGIELGKVIDLWKLPNGRKMATLHNCRHQYVRSRKRLRKVKKGEL
jgi:hypothetical protein